MECGKEASTGAGLLFFASFAAFLRALSG